MPTFAVAFEKLFNHLINVSMNQYETVFILTPVLSDVQMKEALQDVSLEELKIAQEVLRKIFMNTKD